MLFAAAVCAPRKKTNASCSLLSVSLSFDPPSLVAGLMLKHGIKRVPVLRDSTIVGIVSRINLLQALVSPCDSAATARPLGNVTPPGDSHLRDTVTAALKAKNWSLVQRSDLVVNSGIVHLWGVAPSPELMQAYSAAVARVPGVVAVQSHMHVLPA